MNVTTRLLGPKQTDVICTRLGPEDEEVEEDNTPIKCTAEERNK